MSMTPLSQEPRQKQHLSLPDLLVSRTPLSYDSGVNGTAESGLSGVSVIWKI
jgi:hypothetical protein